ncbi:nuclear transport factor 2 family protein [Nocardia vermiculata]|uniref:SnoaL-like domain-containing protein n=1 Tax=Nocardia vermiculata TaxID=257274 RepID=A0A846XUL8_9NOCA|nr:nuclear transport factor 2 family protein [Nocardia vermiculata]NKY49550.1 SnoaL-like domain-containing protein [Nocardia vermiculata]
MSANASAAELLATVELSPQAVGVHDRAAWVDLFAPDARVEDPVGSTPHTGRAAIERFYDTFIAPNTIEFAVDHDVVRGTTVYRDLTLATTMSTGVTLHVPMHLRYDLRQVDAEWRIDRLYAHWELPVMVGQLLAAGGRGLTAAAKLAPQLLGNQGATGALGFARGFIRVGAAGKRAATGMLDAASRGDVAAVRAVLAPTAVVQWPAGEPIGHAEFVNRLRGAEISKPVAAGKFVTVSVRTAEGERGVAELEMDGQRVARLLGFVSAG